MIIAVDFDGTIVHSAYPQVGKRKFLALPVLRWAHSRGHKLILYTCRIEPHLHQALKSLPTADRELFSAVNENLPERIAQYGGDCRKISADMLIDDRAGVVWWWWQALRILWLERWVNK